MVRLKRLTEDELEKIVGGATISGTLINSFSTVLKTIYSLGKSLGTSLRRMSSNNLCSL